LLQKFIIYMGTNHETEIHSTISRGDGADHVKCLRRRLAKQASASRAAACLTWTGVYVGGQLGYAWTTNSDGQVYSPTGAAIAGQPAYNQAGVIGGVHAGYNWQMTQFVLGIEGDVEGSTLKGNGPYGGRVYSMTTENNIQGSVRGRIGYAWDHVLFYATGGVSFASFKDTYLNTASTVEDEVSPTRTGWTAGGGIEYMFRPNWSIRLEYRYSDYGHYNDLLAFSSGGTLGLQRHETVNTARVGISYHFDMLQPLAPIVAKY
jgi:outer membrane immunogenic protein